jgi:hypothetical protein
MGSEFSLVAVDEADSRLLSLFTREMGMKMLDMSLRGTGAVSAIPRLLVQSQNGTDMKGMTIGRVVLIPVTAKLGHRFSVQV